MTLAAHSRVPRAFLSLETAPLLRSRSCPACTQASGRRPARRPRSRQCRRRRRGPQSRCGRLRCRRRHRVRHPRHWGSSNVARCPLPGRHRCSRYRRQLSCRRGRRHRHLCCRVRHLVHRGMRIMASLRQPGGCCCSRQYRIRGCHRRRRRGLSHHSRAAACALQENLAHNTRFLTGNPRFSGISEYLMRVNLGFLAPEPGSCGSTRDYWSAQGTGAALLRPECRSARAPRPLRSLWRPRAPCSAPPRPDAAAPRRDSGLGGGEGRALSDCSLVSRCPRLTAPRPRAPTSTGCEDGAGRETQKCTGRLSLRWKAFLKPVAGAEKSGAWNP